MQDRLKDWCKKNEVRLIKAKTLETLRKCGDTEALGRGAYGSCTKTDAFDVKVAVKKFSKDIPVNCIIQELTGLKTNQGPGVQEIVGFCPETCELVSAFSGISLEECIQQELVTPQKAACILHQVMLIVRNMLKRNQCHNDIKPGNICVKGISTQYPKVTLIDFGLATSLGEYIYEDAGEEEDYRFQWLAPEMRRGGKCSEASEVYSISHLARRLAPAETYSTIVEEWLDKGTSHLPKDRSKLSFGIFRVSTLIESWKKREQPRKHIKRLQKARMNPVVVLKTMKPKVIRKTCNMYPVVVLKRIKISGSSLRKI